MPDNLESFVKKLQSEGVDAGKAAAEKLKKEAEEAAEKIISRAHEEADEIIQKAKADAQKQKKNAQSEMKMVVRDAILRLRESLKKALSRLISYRVEEDFKDTGYLKEIVREVVLTYTKKDADPDGQVEIEVSEDIPDDWIQQTMTDLSEQLQTSEDNIRIQASLKKAGFDYHLRDGTVEVSPESVTDLLLEMINPKFQEVVSQALGGTPGETPEKEAVDTEDKEKKDA
jgi:vacuolar-type H+-ATPase subunit H